MDGKTEQALDDLVSDLLILSTTEVTASDHAPVTDDDPLAYVSLEDIMGGYGLRKGDNTSRTLVKNKEVYRNHEAVEAEREARKRRHARRLKAIERARKRAQEREEKEANTPTDPYRMRLFLALVGTVVPLVADLVMQRYRRFKRVLGENEGQDIAQNCVLRIAEALARADIDLGQAADVFLWLQDAPQPLVFSDGPEGTRRIVGTMMRAILREIVDTYRRACQVVERINPATGEVEKINVTLESWDRLETIARASGTEVDTLISHTKANRMPGTTGARMPVAGRDHDFARAIVESYIEAKGLGAAAYILTDVDNLQTNGAFRWQENADLIWSALGIESPLALDDPRARGRAAMRATRLMFEHLPWAISEATRLASTPEILAYTPHLWAVEITLHPTERTTGRNVEMAAGFDKVMRDLHNGERFVLEGDVGEKPALVQLYEGPGPDVYSKIKRMEPAERKCSHGRHKIITGVTKKAYQWPRPWKMEVCAASRDDATACNPIFGGGDTIRVQHAIPTKVTASQAMAELESMLVEL